MSQEQHEMYKDWCTKISRIISRANLCECSSELQLQKYIQTRNSSKPTTRNVRTLIYKNYIQIFHVQTLRISKLFTTEKFRKTYMQGYESRATRNVQRLVYKKYQE